MNIIGVFTYSSVEELEGLKRLTEDLQPTAAHVLTDEPVKSIADRMKDGFIDATDKLKSWLGFSASKTDAEIMKQRSSLQHGTPVYTLSAGAPL
jgi:hypothetical protein